MKLTFHLIIKSEIKKRLLDREIVLLINQRKIFRSGLTQIKSRAMEIIVIGYIDSEHPTGPSNVVDSVIKGLEELEVNFKFINVYTNTVKSKVELYKKLLTIVFSKDLCINVHTLGYKIPLIVYLMSRINKKNKYFLTVHGVRSYENMLNHIKTRKMSRVIERKLYEGMPNIICVSTYAKDIFLKLFNHPYNTYVIQNGLAEVNKSYTNKNGLRFIYAGGYSALKEPIECLEIFKDIVEIFPKAFLTMCGPVVDKTLLCEVKKFVKTNNLENNILIEQKLQKSELIRLYEDASFILAPSSFDTFNMTVLEAMNRGCIPIISANCGVKDILEDDCGLIYKETMDVAKWIKQIDIENESKKSFEISLRNTYLEMAEKYVEKMECIDE